MKFFIKTLALAAAAIISVCLFFYFADILLAPSSKPNVQSQVCLKNHCFIVEIAKTKEARAQGLMFRKSLAQNHGMLFVFDKEGIYSFWMKNMLIPLDIIWIGENNKVVFISKHSQPCAELSCPMLDPKVNALYVLEANAGTSDELGLEIGIDTAFYGIMD